MLLAIVCYFAGIAPSAQCSAETQGASPAGLLLFDIQDDKSLGINILPITPLDGIFCEERLFLPLYFQYFADEGGGG